MLKYDISYIRFLFSDIRNRFPGKEKSEQNVEDIPVSSSERKRNVRSGGLVIAFLTQPQDSANVEVFRRVFFGNSHQLLTNLSVCILTYLNLPTKQLMQVIRDHRILT